MESMRNVFNENNQNRRLIVSAVIGVLIIVFSYLAVYLMIWALYWLLD